jgi:hypothetical protein
MNEVTKHSPMYSEIKEYFEDFLSEQEEYHKYVNLVPLHGDEEEERHEKLSEFFQGAFNTDYYIIGTHRAKEWCGSDTWEIIQTVSEYEETNFGEVATPLDNPERVVSMYAYIVGEHILSHYFNKGV